VDFSSYVLTHKERLLEIREFLMSKIPDDPHAMTEDLQKSNVHFASLNEIRPYAEAFLAAAEATAYEEMEGNVTEKRIKLAGKCLEQRKFASLMERRCKVIDKRIESTRTLISAAKEERRGNR